MRITFYTPLSLSSAIGRSAVGIAEELHRRGHNVQFIRTEHARSLEDQPHPTKLSVRWWHDVLPQEVARQSDIVLLNLGDNFGFHAGVVSIIDEAPCLGLFHDFFLYSFFRDWALTRSDGNFALHDAEIVRVYGTAAKGDMSNLAGNQMPLADIAARYPMTEWLAARCSGALAHSTFYSNRLEAACSGPVAVTALSYAPRDVDPLSERSGGPVSLLTVGHVNTNKCCTEVIRALAQSQHGKACAYRIAGPVTPADRAVLEAVATDVGYAGLQILGAVTDEELVSELARADIICCLRRPVLEGASASAIEALMAGRPVVVANAGFYADLPDDLVCKVPADVPVQPLADILDRLISDETLRRETGGRARAWSRNVFTPENYVNALEALISDVVSLQPYSQLGTIMSCELRALGLSAEDAAVVRLAETLQQLWVPAVSD